MCREVPILVTRSLQVIGQQLEMQCLFLCHGKPVAVKGLRHVGKAPDNVQGQVDGIGLDVRQCMDQAGTTLRRAYRTMTECARLHQVWPLRAPRHRCTGVDQHITQHRVRRRVQCSDSAGFVLGLAQQQQAQRLLAQPVASICSLGFRRY
jgi:hypothetical protein